MAKEKTKSEVQDDLADVLAKTLNAKFKDNGYKVAYFLDTEKDNPAAIKGWVGSGSDMLDLAISNRPHGGFPVGRITEITGLEASGKSLLAAHALANTQKQGGLAVYIDTENAISEDFLQAIGVNIKDMLYVPLETVEDIFTAIEDIILQVRKSSKNRLVTIVVDSIMAASTKTEMAADFDKDGYATSKAILLSKAMRKVTNMIGREQICLLFTNQLRTKLNAMFGDPYTTSGGKALAFHASVRLRLKGLGQIKGKVNGIDQVVGIKTQVQVIKNRLGPPLKVINYDIYFDSGIDNVGGWLNVLKAYKIVKQSGAWYEYVTIDGELKKFQSKDFNDIISDPEIREELYQKICDNYIMSYTPGKDGGIDDIKVVDMFSEGDEIAQALDGNAQVTDVE